MIVYCACGGFKRICVWGRIWIECILEAMWWSWEYYLGYTWSARQWKWVASDIIIAMALQKHDYGDIRCV
jgi:hypothetical protein